MGALLLALAAAGGTLVVDVTNVRNTNGVVHIDVCTQDVFLKSDCHYVASVPAHVGVTTLTISDLPIGDYAIQAYHDENDNHKVDRDFLGIPKEGIGFSRNAKIKLGPPKWADAMFAFDGREMRTDLKLKYYLGPSGPPVSGR